MVRLAPDEEGRRDEVETGPQSPGLRPAPLREHDACLTRRCRPAFHGCQMPESQQETPFRQPGTVPRQVSHAAPAPVLLRVGDTGSHAHLASPLSPDDLLNHLRQACAFGDSRRAQHLLARLPNTQDPATGETPLFLACSGGHTTLVKALLAAGANCYLYDNQGVRLLHTCADPEPHPSPQHAIALPTQCSHRAPFCPMSLLRACAMDVHSLCRVPSCWCVHRYLLS